ncbi:cation-transporting P-type ATPase [Raineyella sp. LH-20]|uniref:cation-translocating P-type ATPase n=1 Tax=Raineyella sp. LH-20 TaxID=3081204 RepID=UPI0029549E53|nr:cation-transporting P-type ATPase [Raineyella sp. LH-20]WOP18132.1 cation-transporting P-type ATPase [Raineyella sp. LH-20]
MDAITQSRTSTGTDVHRLTADDALRTFGPGDRGLASSQVAELLARHGPNVLREQARRPLVLVFAAEFTSPMAILLWVGGLVALLAGIVELGIAIVVVNVVNGVFGFWQEYRAERATEELKKLLSGHVTVVRDGEVREIPTQDLVPGDLLVVAEGDRIGADARLVEASDLQIDQSALSGESRAVHKDAGPVAEDLPAAQLHNMVFAGTSVMNGDGRAVVTATGMATEFGRIADLTQSVREEPSPLQKELGRLTRQLSVLALGLGALFVVVAVVFVGEPWARAFVFGLGMVVAFIPEGLLPTVTLSLAMAVQRMARRHALVKKLSSVETLGCTTVICSDKTGTLTQNEMTVTDLWVPGVWYAVDGRGYAPEGMIHRQDPVATGSTTGTATTTDDRATVGPAGAAPQDTAAPLASTAPQDATATTDPALRTLLEAAGLCNNSAVRPPAPDESRWTVHGDPTEACLLVVAAKAGLDPEALQRERPRLRELAFDSRRKRMTTIHQADGRRLAYVKGAPQCVPPQCSWIVRDGVRREMTEADRAEITAVNDGFARRGLRVLAVAVRTVDVVADPATYTVDEVERELTFLGLVAMEDPPREGIAEAVATCHRASIRIIMITGDYGLTAESIARSIGVVRGADVRVVSGTELARMSEEDLVEALRGELIFARVAPEQKFRVVATLQSMGEIVAVTGDGVNDAPALKRADIGIAMGRTGTDVSKEAADMILTDDHFASIVTAIDEGRGVYDNIRKFLTYILTSNMAEAAPSAVFLVSRGVVPLPLTVMQILTIDLGTDLLPALGLGTERPESDVMDRPPRPRSQRLMDRRVLGLAFGWYGLLEAVFALVGYLVVNVANGWPAVPFAADGELYARATTMTLAAIIFCQIGAVLGCRTTSVSLWTIGIFSNRRIVWGIVAEIVLLAALSYVPLLQGVFGTAPLLLADWAALAVLPVAMVLLDEVRRGYVRHQGRVAEREAPAVAPRPR